MLNKVKGISYPEYLIKKLLKINSHQLFQTRVLLSNMEGKQFKQLHDCLNSILVKVQRIKPKKQEKIQGDLLLNESSKRAIEAKRLKKEAEGKKGLKQYDVSGFLGKRLEALYKRSRIEGALTQDKVGDYLSQFQNYASEMITDLEINTQTVEAFESNANESIDKISAEGFLSGNQTSELKRRN